MADSLVPIMDIMVRGQLMDPHLEGIRACTDDQTTCQLDTLDIQVANNILVAGIIQVLLHLSNNNNLA